MTSTTILCLFFAVFIVVDSIELNSAGLESKLIHATQSTSTTPVAAISRLYDVHFYYQFCSGYFAAPNFVFTAGLCIREIKEYIAENAHNIFVHRKSNTAQRTSASCTITKMEEFYEYNAVKKVLPNNNLDLGLLMVECSNPESSSMTTFSVGLSNIKVEPNNRGTIFGWSFPFRDPAKSKLASIEIKAMDKEECLNYFQDTGIINDEYQMCASPRNIDAKTIEGDHGCPVFGETQHIIGVVTHITGEGTAPTVFDRVDKLAQHMDNWMYYLLTEAHFCASQNPDTVLRYFIK